MEMSMQGLQNFFVFVQGLLHLVLVLLLPEVSQARCWEGD